MSANEDPLGKKTILIVEDEKFVELLFRKALESAGYNTLSAADGQAAMNLLPTLVADLILLDLMLPKVGGIQVLEAIRADKRLRDIPVLVISNAYLPELAKKALLAGATLGVTKSECTRTCLVQTVKQLLQPATVSDTKNATGQRSHGLGH